MKPVIIFGLGSYAALVHHYLSQQAGYEVAGFTVDDSFLSIENFCNLKAVPFEKVEKYFPVNRFEMIVAVGYSRMNRVREAKCAEAKGKGYQLGSFVHPSTSQWKGMNFGENFIAFENNVFQPHSKIGNNVCVWAGSVICHHAELGNNVYVAPGAVISGEVKVGDNCFIGSNATIRNGLKIAKNCVIGAGAVILEDTQENGVYVAPQAKKLDVHSLDLKSL